MISFQRATLENGLRIIVNEDVTTPLVALALAYDVGAKDEDVELTGFAHLFEHLMFGGSVHIPRFDEPLEMAGGTNNAFTSNDITCYHCTLPAENLETAFWLESDRMLSLAFSPESLEVQRSVVIEEFKQHYLNAPYGDSAHLLCDLAYKVHPYRWPTIGITPEHVEKATMESVKAFFHKHYLPCNAVLVLSGNVTLDRAIELAEKWFAPIPAGTKPRRKLPQEPKQTEERRLTVTRDVPSDAIFMAFHMGGMLDDDYPVCDAISDILSNGRSGRFNERLITKLGLFDEASASIFGSTDPGLFLIHGFLREGVSFKEAEEAIWHELDALQETTEAELLKVKGKYKSTILFEELSIESRAVTLAEYEVVKNADMANERVARQEAVTLQQIKETARQMFVRENASVLEYAAKRS